MPADGGAGSGALIVTVAAGITLTAGSIMAAAPRAGIGGASRPPEFLAQGDVVAIAIDPIDEPARPVE